MGIRGQLQLSGAVITCFEVKSIDANHDHITISLESQAFVDLLGTNRIRLLFSGCRRTQAELLWQDRGILHGVYIREDLPQGSEYIAYCIQTSSNIGCYNVFAQKMQVEVDTPTHNYH